MTFELLKTRRSCGAKKVGKFSYEVIGKALGFSLNQEQTCRITRSDWFRGNLIGGKVVG